MKDILKEEENKRDERRIAALLIGEGLRSIGVGIGLMGLQSDGKFSFELEKFLDKNIDKDFSKEVSLYILQKTFGTSFGIENSIDENNGN